MNLNNFEDLDRILDNLEPDHIPSEFVRAARVTDLEGESQIITVAELEEIMMGDDSLEDMGIVDVRLILDLEEIKRTVRKYSEMVLVSVQP